VRRLTLVVVLVACLYACSTAVPRSPTAAPLGASRLASHPSSSSISSPSITDEATPGTPHNSDNGVAFEYQTPSASASISAATNQHPSAPTATTVISALPTCSPIELPDLGSKDPTSGGFGHVQPPILLSALHVTRDELASRGFDVQQLHAPSPLVALLGNVQGTGAYAYFAPSPLNQDTTLNDLYNEGGVLATEEVAYGHDAQKVKSVLGDRAFIIDLGPYKAALSLGSSLADGGRRPYDIFWSDGTHDWFVAAGTATAAEAVAVARSNYCS
jgi:hypothetical protein